MVEKKATKIVVEEEIVSEEEESDWYESDHEIEYQGPVTAQRYIVGTKIAMKDMARYRRNAMLVIDPNRLKKTKTLKRTVTKRQRIIETEIENPEEKPQKLSKNTLQEKRIKESKTQKTIKTENIQQSGQAVQEKIKVSGKDGKQSELKINKRESEQKVTNEVKFEQQKESSFSSDSNYKTSDDEKEKVEIGFGAKKEAQSDFSNRNQDVVSESVASAFNVGMQEDELEAGRRDSAKISTPKKKMVYETSNEPSQMSRIVTVEIDSESVNSHQASQNNEKLNFKNKIEHLDSVNAQNKTTTAQFINKNIDQTMLAQSHSTTFVQLGSSRELGSSPIATRPPSAQNNMKESNKFDASFNVQVAKTVNKVAVPIQIPPIKADPVQKSTQNQQRPSKFFNIGVEKSKLQNKSTPQKQSLSQKPHNVQGESNLSSKASRLNSDVKSGVTSLHAVKIQQQISTASQLKSKQNSNIKAIESNPPTGIRDQAFQKENSLQMLKTQEEKTKNSQQQGQNKSAPPKNKVSAPQTNLLLIGDESQSKISSDQNSVNSARIQRRQHKNVSKRGQFLDPTPIIMQPEVIDYNTDVDKKASFRKQMIKTDSFDRLEQKDDVLSAQNQGRQKWQRMKTDPVNANESVSNRKYKLDFATQSQKQSQENKQHLLNQSKTQTSDKLQDKTEKFRADLKTERKVTRSQFVTKTFTRKIKKKKTPEEAQDDLLSKSGSESFSRQQSIEHSSSSSSSHGKAVEKSLDYYENEIDKLSSQKYSTPTKVNDDAKDQSLDQQNNLDNPPTHLQDAQQVKQKQKSITLQELDRLKIKNEQRSSLVEVKAQVDKYLEMMEQSKKKKPQSFLQTKQQELKTLIENRKQPLEKIPKAKFRDPIQSSKKKSKFAMINQNQNSGQDSAQKLIKVPNSSQSQRKKDLMHNVDEQKKTKHYITESESSFYLKSEIEADQKVPNPEKAEILNKNSAQRSLQNKSGLKSNLKKGSSHSSGDPNTFSNNLSGGNKSGEKKQVRFINSTKVWIKREIRSKQVELFLSDTDLEEYAFHQKLSTFSQTQRSWHLIRLWRTCYNIAFTSSVFIKILLGFKYKVQLFGVQLVQKQQMQKKKASKPRWFVILPNQTIKAYWNALMIIILILVAIFLPIQVGFYSYDSQLVIAITHIINLLFFIDLGLNFLFAYEQSDGRLQFDLKSIAKNYLKSWFFVDLISILPIQIFTPETVDLILVSMSNNTSKSLQVLRWFQILKLLKILRYKQLTRKIGSTLKISPSKTQMVNLIISCLLMTHLASCLWYFSSRIVDFNELTWVTRKGFLPTDNFFLLYFESQYWALQVLTTVGYGDFGAQTVIEYLINIFWMVVGVGFYQIIFAQIVSIIGSNPLHESIIDEKLLQLELYQRQKRMPEELYENIRSFLLNNHLELFTRVDEQKLLNELPKTLKFETMLIQFGPLVERIGLLRDAENSEFVWEVVQKAQKTFFDRNDVIYVPGDYVESFYMIFEGSCLLVTPSGHTIVKYGQGDLLRDNDALLGLPCDSRCIALESCTLYQVKIADLAPIFARMPKVQRKMERYALMKKHRHDRIKAMLKRKYPEVTQLAIDGKLGMIKEYFIRKLRHYGVEATNKRKNFASEKFSSKFYSNHSQQQLIREQKAETSGHNEQSSNSMTEQIVKIDQYLNLQKQIIEQPARPNQISQKQLKIWKFLPKNHTHLSIVDREKIINGIKEVQKKVDRQNASSELNKIRASSEQETQEFQEQKIAQTIDSFVITQDLVDLFQKNEKKDLRYDSLKNLKETQSCEKHNLNVESQVVIKLLSNFNSDVLEIDLGLEKLQKLLEEITPATRDQQTKKRQLEEQTIQIVEKQKLLEKLCEKITQENSSPDRLQVFETKKRRTTFSGLDPSDLAYIQEQKNLTRISSSLKVAKKMEDQQRVSKNDAPPVSLSNKTPTKQQKNPQSRTGSSF